MPTHTFYSRRKYKADPRETKRGRQKLLASAETVKHVLSTLDTANCYIESLYEGIDFNANVTRARFENELSKVVADMVAPLRELVKKAEIGAESVEKVRLVRIIDRVKCLVREEHLLNLNYKLSTWSCWLLISTIQGDTSRWPKPPVDFKTKFLAWPAWPACRILAKHS